MRARVLLWSSLALNVLLTGLLLLLGRDSEQLASPAPIVVQGQSRPLIKTNVVLRRQPFSWQEIESQDYRVFIANLRWIGCPEKTIHDIIVADVNELFAERISREVTVPEQKWWLPDPDLDSFEASMNQIRALEEEKNQMLTQLLGANWSASRSNAPASVVRFDGPVLGKLPAAVKAGVERIEAAARRSYAEIVERAREANQAPDDAELLRLRQETRKQLASILAPDQLEEYLLRYSTTADRMRAELRGFRADADEFRKIFRIRDQYEQQLADLTGNDPAVQRRRAELERLRDQAIGQELGPERFSFYQMTQNPLFREAQEQAEANGAPAEKVLPIFEVNRATREEIERIQRDQTLSEDQRKVMLAAVQQQQRNSIERILGGAPPETPEQRPAPEPERPVLLPPLPPPPPGVVIVPVPVP